MYTTDNAGHIYRNVLMKMWVWMVVRWYYGQSETFIKSRQVTISSFPVEIQIYGLCDNRKQYCPPFVGAK